MAKNENSNFSYMTRRIGGTTYKVMWLSLLISQRKVRNMGHNK